MWFITSIVKENFSPQSKNKRTFGFYEHYVDAYKAVKENRCNMCECLYDYIVIEYMEEGIHPEVHKEQWFKWDDHLNRWDMSEIDKPNEFIGWVNWAIG
jgi:hypothetical protein